MRRRHRRSRVTAGTPRNVSVRHNHHVEFRYYTDVLREKESRERQRAYKKTGFDYRPVEDLRRVSDDIGQRAFKTTSGRIARTENRPQSQMSGRELSSPVRTYFRDPRRVLVCIRRHDRRRVLFALRKVGKGKKVSPVHRWTEKSDMRCK